MVFAVAACIVAGIIFILERKRKPMIKKMSLIIFMMALLGILVQFREEQDKVLDAESGVISRNDAGEGEVYADLVLNADDMFHDYEYEITVPEVVLDQKQSKELFLQAEQEIEDTFPGENESLTCVDQDVVIKASYQKGLVTAEWSFDNYEYIDQEGHLRQEQIPEEGYLELATCELKCGEYTCTYEFYFELHPKKLGNSERLLKKLEENLEVQKKEENNPEIVLPTELDGYQLRWTEKQSEVAWKFVLLGVIASIGVWMTEIEKRKKQEREREVCLTLEYPEIVSKLALLLGAGMTLNAAWNRISASYLDERKKNNHKIRPAYEEMLITCRETESGIGERMAYEHFGDRCGMRRYRKLSSLLVQNVKKGTKGLAALLEQEAEDAFEERKNTAKKLGEEAGTKLLFPMLLMLGIVIALIMIPAVLSFQI